MLNAKWAEYAKSWSQPTEAREAALAALVTDDVTYTDPNNHVQGRKAFAAHMAQFQTDVPGGYFEITDVKEHHNQTLAHWTLCRQGGAKMMDGISHATLTDGGKFSAFTGFF
jgi:hypothetical protein